MKHMQFQEKQKQEKLAFEAKQRREEELAHKESGHRMNTEGKIMKEKADREVKERASEKAKPKKPIKLKVVRDKDGNMAGAEIN
jgi:hypothetical protein